MRDILLFISRVVFLLFFFLSAFVGDTVRKVLLLQLANDGICHKRTQPQIRRRLGQSWWIERSSPLPEVPTDTALSVVVEQIFGGAHP